MNIELRQHQIDATEAVFHSLSQGVRKQLVALPTGTGKTILAIHISMNPNFKKVLFLVHRQELVEQTAESLLKYDTNLSPEDIGYIWKKNHDLDRHLTIGMIQTLYSRIDTIPSDAFDLVIMDEAHHAVAKTYREVLDKFEPILRLGLSATPERTDGAPLSNLFDAITFELSVKEAIKRGMIVGPKAVQVTTGSSLQGVKTLAGDFNQKELQDAIDNDERNKLVVDTYRNHAHGRKALVFTAGVKHARNLTNMFRNAGISADSVSCYDQDRDARICAMKEGFTQVMCNAMILTEGFDYPDISCIMLARPTKSKPLYVQMMGRGLRLAENKEDCILVDFMDIAGKHNLMSAWKFFGKRVPPKENQGPYNPMGDTEDEELLLAAQGKFKDFFNMTLPFPVIEKYLDIFSPAPEVDLFTVGDKDWHYQPATEKQLALLEKHGYDVINADWTRGNASALIGQLPASDKQLKFLFKHEFDVFSMDWTMNHASAAFDKIKKDNIQPNWGIEKKMKSEGKKAQLEEKRRTRLSKVTF